MGTKVYVGKFTGKIIFYLISCSKDGEPFSSHVPKLCNQSFEKNSRAGKYMFISSNKQVFFRLFKKFH